MEVETRSLDVHFRRSAWVRPIVLQVVLLAVVGAAWRWGVFPAVVAGLFTVLVLLVMATFVGVAVRASRHPLAARIDSAGVALQDCPTIPWNHLAGIEIAPLRSSQPVGRPPMVVALLPRPGATLLPPSDRWVVRWARRSRVRRFGTSLVIPTFATDVSAGEVAAAAARLAGLPVVERPVRRGVQLLARLLLGALLLGVGLLVAATLYLLA